jgi:chromosome segregation ATPase
MTVDLCANVNFIHGQNGSGKSAILAAVQICLGAGARRTHRARNLKELVRKEAGEHCTGAKVRVTLLNGGDDGFQQNVYGDLITVERNISLRASSGAAYRLLDEHGVCRSTSKKDLDSMLDQLNIQVENPVAVLDQEEAKKFLTGKAQDKYQFFAKATELERMDRSYANVVDNITELEENKKKVQDSLQSKVDMVRKLKKEWEEYQILEKLQDKVLDCRVDYGWAFYQTVQEELNQEVAKLQQFNAKREKRQAELTQAETLTNGPDQEQELMEERLQQLTDETQEAADTKRQLETDLKKAMVSISFLGLLLSCPLYSILTQSTRPSFFIYVGSS